MRAIGRNLRIKHKKAQIVASMVGGMQVDEALKLLKYLPKKAAQMIYKVLKSAISNAEHNLKKDPKNLIIKHIIVNKGKELKRIRPISRGRAHGITKGVAHIRIVLEEFIEKIEEKKVSKKVKTKKVEKKAPKKVIAKKPTKKSNSK